MLIALIICLFVICALLFIVTLLWDRTREQEKENDALMEEIESIHQTKEFWENKYKNHKGIKLL